jgi:hypothetical protein
LTGNSIQLGKDSPIKNFRPRLWKDLDIDADELRLDLFWPVKIDNDDTEHAAHPAPRDEDGNIIVEETSLSLRELKPILAFRKLSVLHLEGMMRSYQPLIWQVVWSNPKLTTLSLGMALEPLFNKDTRHPNRKIDARWTVFPVIDASLSDLTINSTRSTPADTPDTYLGADGTGSLHPTYGDGEYLDVLCIHHAQKAAADAATLPTTHLRYLPLRHLQLRSFVLDGLALERWFNSATLATITFAPGCVDAGFYLPRDMQHVKLVVAEQLLRRQQHSRPATVSSASSAAVPASPTIATTATTTTAVKIGSGPTRGSALQRFKSTLARVPGLSRDKGNDKDKDKENKKPE